MKLAIFGGTFDPIHNAHLAAAREAADRFHLDRVLFVPAARPPHKQGGAHAGFEDRVRMAGIACGGDPRFEVSRLEEDTELSYSIETIEKLRAQMAPGDELFFIIGADAFAEVQTWRRWRDVARGVHFLVVSRPGCEYSVPREIRYDRLDNLQLGVSSTTIRRDLAEGHSPADLPPEVLSYIRTHHLYGPK